MDGLELLLDLVLGLSLAAACGMRVFVPFWFASLASVTGHLTPVPAFAWLGEPVTLGVLTVAALAEAAAFLVPWVDHALDVAAGPAAVVAGAVLAGAFVGEVDPLVRWTLIAVAGGGAAGAVHGVAAVARAASTALTGGVGNPVFAAAESVGSALVAGLAVLAPGVAMLVLVAAVIAVRRRLAARRAA